MGLLSVVKYNLLKWDLTNRERLHMSLFSNWFEYTLDIRLYVSDRALIQPQMYVIFGRWRSGIWQTDTALHKMLPLDRRLYKTVHSFSHRGQHVCSYVISFTLGRRNGTNLGMSKWSSWCCWQVAWGRGSAQHNGRGDCGTILLLMLMLHILYIDQVCSLTTINVISKLSEWLDSTNDCMPERWFWNCETTRC